MKGCVFCDLIGSSPLEGWAEAVAFAPRRPITPGHVLVVPREHVADATANPWVTAVTMYRAAELAGRLDRHCNIITSVGSDATQTVYHLHIHVVPRRVGDGLVLPWSHRG